MVRKATVRVPAQTSSQRQSIWQAVPLQTFYRNVETLSKLTGKNPSQPDVELCKAAALYPYRASLRRRSTAQPGSQRMLRLEDERQLVNDLAFIAASEEGVRAVSAAYVEEKAQSKELVVHLAANEGVPEDVEVAIKDILSSLEQASGGGAERKPLEDLREDIFGQIVALNQHRIIARIRTAFGKAPGFTYAGQSALESDHHLENIIARMERESSIPAARLLVQRLRDVKTEAFRLATDPRKSDPSLSSETLQLTRSVVQDCYSALSDNGTCDFEAVIAGAGLSKQRWLDNKELVTLDKIGSYHRIARTLARLFGRKSGLRGKCDRLALKKPLSPYEPVRMHIPGAGDCFDCHTHAEVQLMVELLCSDETSQRPRVMGSSKDTCYLCYLFLKSVDQIETPPTHRQLFKGWFIPDLANYRPEQVRILRTTINRMNAVITNTAKTNRTGNGIPALLKFALTSRHRLGDVPASVFSDSEETVTSLSHASVVDRSSLPGETIHGFDGAGVLDSIMERLTLGHKSTPAVVECEANTATDGVEAEIVAGLDSTSDRRSTSSNKSAETCLNSTEKWTELTSISRRTDPTESSKLELYVEIESPGKACGRYVEVETLQAERHIVMVGKADLKPGVDVLVERPASEKTLLLDLRSFDEASSILELRWL